MLRGRTALPRTAAISFRTVLTQVNGAELEISDELAKSLFDRNHSHVDLGELTLPPGWSVVRDNDDAKDAEVRRIVRLSLPGVSADGSEALVAVERDYNRSCCPEGYAVLLQYRDGAWVVKAHGAQWIV